MRWPEWPPRRRRRRSRSPMLLALSRRLRSRDAGNRVLAKRLDGRARGKPAGRRHPAAHRADVRSWTGYREEVWTLVEQQRAAGVRTAVLSNGVPEIMEVIERERAISTKFDTVVVSQRSAARNLMPRSSS
jgi:FMN phosphatase YigB (HAD superfamily)